MKKNKNKQKNNLIYFLIIAVLLLLVSLFIATWLTRQVEEEEDLGLIYLTDFEEKDEDRLEEVIIDSDLVVPDYHEDLEEIRDDLNNSQVIIAFLNKHFEFNEEFSYIAQEPKDFYQNRSGNATDAAVFVANYLNPSIVPTSIIRYDFVDNNNQEASNFLSIIRDKNADSKYISLCKIDNRLKLYVYGKSFRDLMDIKENKLNININRFGIFLSNQRDLSEIKEPFTWQAY